MARPLRTLYFYASTPCVRSKCNFHHAVHGASAPSASDSLRPPMILHVQGRLATSRGSATSYNQTTLYGDDDATRRRLLIGPCRRSYYTKHCLSLGWPVYSFPFHLDNLASSYKRISSSLHPGNLIAFCNFHCGVCRRSSVVNWISSLLKYNKTGMRYVSTSSSDSSDADGDGLKVPDDEMKELLKEIVSDFKNEIEEGAVQPTVTDQSDVISSGSSSDSGSSDSDSDSSSDSDIETSNEGSNDLRGKRPGGIDVDHFVDQELKRPDYEEFEEMSDSDMFEEDQADEEIQLPISLNRGLTGVYDIDEMVTLLQEENVADLCVIRIPPEMMYTDHLVVATGKSTRHIRAVAELLKWVYKRKRGDQDPNSCRIEGLLSTDWFALDLGNMVVHLMLQQTRELYDLETLWTVGPDYDEKLQADTAKAAVPILVTTTSPQPGSAEHEAIFAQFLDKAKRAQPRDPKSLDSWTGYHSDTVPLGKPKT